MRIPVVEFGVVYFSEKITLLMKVKIMSKHFSDHEFLFARSKDVYNVKDLKFHYITFSNSAYFFQISCRKKTWAT